MNKSSAIIPRILFHPTLAWTILLGRVFKIREWWSQIHENVVLGALPLLIDPEQLNNMNIGAVLNLCNELSGDETWYRNNGISYLRLPFFDYTSPDINTVTRAVGFIDNCIREGVKVYVHCKAGRGRSATVVLCWLMSSENLSSEDAMKILVEKIPHVNWTIHKRDIVKEFERDEQN